MMSRMLLMSSSCVLVLLLCLISHKCNARHLSMVGDHAIDNKAKILGHSTIKGLEDDPLTVHDDLKLETTNAKVKKDCGSNNNKGMNKDQKVKKFKDLVHRHHHHQHHPKSITFQVPRKNKGADQQPGFNLDYSPPKTHPPSHN